MCAKGGGLDGGLNLGWVGTSKPLWTPPPSYKRRLMGHPLFRRQSDGTGGATRTAPALCRCDAFNKTVFPAVPFETDEEYYAGEVTPVLHYTMGTCACGAVGAAAWALGRASDRVCVAALRSLDWLPMPPPPPVAVLRRQSAVR